MPKPPFITRVQLRNYKSIARCDVELGPLSILVGPNGSGKSNFLDALHFTYGALLWPLAEVLSERGGMREVLRRSGERPDNFSIMLDFALPDISMKGTYGFELKTRTGGGAEVNKEVCEVWQLGSDSGPLRLVVERGEIIESTIKTQLPRPFADRLFLVSASNTEELWPVYNALTEMRFYKFDLDVLRTPQPPESGTFLHTPNGHNLPGVLGAMEQTDPLTFKRIQQYMSVIVPGLESASRLEIPVVNQETIQFKQKFGDRGNPQIFTPVNMSDGTLRALAVLTSLLQGGDFPPSLIEFEEPETALHSAAAGVLWDALTDGCDRAQVLVSTQSPDLLDRDDIPINAILAADMEAGKTEIAPIVESSRQILQERLATPGELLRQNRLSPVDRAFYPQCVLPQSGRHT